MKKLIAGLAVAAADDAKVKALVYVAAFAPEAGETVPVGKMIEGAATAK